MKEDAVLLLVCAIFGLLATSYGRWIERDNCGGNRYTVESFTPDLTITIQCSGDCDLAAMIAEAREAAEK